MVQSLPIDGLDEFFEDEGVPHFQRPFVLQRWREQLTGEPFTLHDIPVDIETFINSPRYLDKGPKGDREYGVIYPTVMASLVELNAEGRYDEAVLTGGIGSAKTTIALYTTAYQLYRLSLYTSPHRQFNLDPASEIMFIFQSINEGTARQVNYNRFMAMLEEAPYFRDRFPYDKDIKSKLVFPRRIEVQPVTGVETATIGQNVIGGCIDEVNHMALVQRSATLREGAQVYDQAVALYNSISRRRASRFMEAGGYLPGILCLPSSKKYPEEFTARKIREARKPGARIFVYDKRSWDIQPPDSKQYSGETFRLLIGDQFTKPRILEEGEKVKPEHEGLVDRIPVEHRNDFDRDLMNALRDVAGHATLAIHPFILRTETVKEAVTLWPSVFSVEECDFHALKVQVRKKLFENPEAPRFAHVDLALDSDAAGLGIGHVVDFVEMVRGDHLVEVLPRIKLDGLLRIPAPPNGEINFAKIRTLLYTIRKLGIPLEWITYDSYQSTDSIQILRGEGFKVGIQSVDKTRMPYELVKGALYDKRLKMPYHAVAMRELASLEDDRVKGMVDHPPMGSKDVSDTVAGVVYGLTMRRAIWALHNIPLSRVPEFLLQGEAEESRGLTAQEDQEDYRQQLAG